MQLQGKVALITGGGTGIGAAIAQRFVAEGARVCITGRRREMLEEVAAALPVDACATCVGDVGDDDNAQAMVDTALSISGRLDILVNNAAIGLAGTIVEMESAVWRQVLETNLTGPFLMMKAAIPHMIEAGGGSIINMASVAGVVCVPGSPGYCATKAGLIHLTKQVALDYGKHKVRVNVVCPGAVRTDLLEFNFRPMAEALGTDLDDIFDRVPKNVPLRRVATPPEITGICTFLASDDSSYMTGSTILIDGGTHFVDVFAASVGEMGLNWG
jgi:meso-butanediol dehydrogenase/(S,S)-butanediol dehydrogenase/diacetyl reductase